MLLFNMYDLRMFREGSGRVRWVRWEAVLMFVIPGAEWIGLDLLLYDWDGWERCAAFHRRGVDRGADDLGLGGAGFICRGVVVKIAGM